MKNIISKVLLICAVVLVSCNKDEEPIVPRVGINVSNLPVLIAPYVYEGWLIVNEEPISVGRFILGGSRENINFSMEVHQQATLDSATAFWLTVESREGYSDKPSNTKILEGSFAGNTAQATFPVFGDSLEIAAKFTLHTPTDNLGGVDNNNDQYGIWFHELNNEEANNFPQLGGGWRYEAWVIEEINEVEIPISVGKFTRADQADESNIYFDDQSETIPLVPGEDLLVNAPEGIEFPFDMRNRKVMVTIEPNPDDIASPFSIKLLSAQTGEEIGKDNPYELMFDNKLIPKAIITKI